MALSRRTSAALGLAVLGVAGLTLASAAQLNVSSASLGAGQSVVASCDDDGITVGFQSGYTSAGYVTTGVVLSDVAEACAGQQVRVTLAGANGAALGAELTATAVAGTTTVPVASPVSAALVENVAVVISG